MTKAKHTDASAERIARSRGADSREAQSASRAAKYHKSRSGGGSSSSGSSGGGGGGGSGGSGDGACQNPNRSGGQCSTYEPCMVHNPNWRV